jgi:hypothetical protein
MRRNFAPIPRRPSGRSGASPSASTAASAKLPLAELEEPTFRALAYDWRDELAATPAECERTIRLLARCIAYGVDRGFLRENRVDGMRYRWQRSSRLRADIIWTPVQIEKIRRHLGPIADAFELSLWSGLRQGDILHLRQDAIENGWLCVVPEKTAHSTGIKVQLPVRELPPLRALVERLRSERRDLLLPDAWHRRQFHRTFHAAKVAAGLGELDLRWHDIRGTTVTWLFQAECTHAETAAVVGHAPAGGQAKHYAAQSRHYTLHAFRKLHTYMQETHREFYELSIARAAER